MRLSALLLLTIAAATQVAAIPASRSAPTAVTEVINEETLKVFGHQQDTDVYVEAKKAGLIVPSGYVPQILQTLENRVDCNNAVTTDKAYDSPILEGIKHLHSLADQGYVCRVGPHTCVRITCSWNAAIMMCNNSDTTKSTTCHEIAGAADVIRTSCLKVDHTIRGQVGTSVGIIVAVGGSPTYC
ncbi:hypothetical protein V492_05792 [Pseudogymnoascus sp. VKM F-4246]|nr:hypothetical protein V492_05792 [Pseudogymnoascus sp. VKM F-4246]